MPVAIGSFLVRYWKALIPTMLLLAFAIGHYFDLRTIRDLKAKVVTLERTIGELTGRVKDDARKLTQRDALIAEQNAKVTALFDKSEKDAADYRKRLEAADRRTEGLRSQITKAQGFQASNPQDAVVTQAELLTMIRESIAEYQKERGNAQ